MFNKSILVALLSLSAVAFAAPKEDCEAPKTVTITVNGAAAQQTAPSFINTGAKAGKAASSASKSGAKSSAAKSSAGKASSSSAKSGSAAKAGSAAKSGAAAAKSSVAAKSGSAAKSGAKAGGAATSASLINTGGAAQLADAGASATGDLQTSTTLDPSVLATAFALDGQQTPVAGQVASLTSTNNFINFCATVPNLPITNGQQVKTGSCNPAPMGIIAANTNMPSTKFVFPVNFGTVAPNTAFTVNLAVKNIALGNFVNAQASYFAAPQTVDGSGNIIGHSHVVIEAIDALNSTTPLDPTKFAFFKGIDGAQDAAGTVQVPVTAGLPAGVYRAATIQSAANHQPVLVAIAQHGSVDDWIYFTVTDATADNAGAGDAAAAASSAAAAASASSVAAAAASSTDVAASTTDAAAATSTDAAATGAVANGQAAIALNASFASIKNGDKCTTEGPTCAGDQFAQCVNGVIVAQACAGGTVCRALPLINAQGTSVSCDTAADATARIAATGATARRRRAFSVKRRS